MLIFDGFPNRDNAEAFTSSVTAKTGRKALVFDSQTESESHDVFPFVLTPPIVMVERRVGFDVDAEEKVEDMVEEYNGVFAGT